MDLKIEKIGRVVLVRASEKGVEVGAFKMVGTELTEVWVRPEQRGHGFGKKLADLAGIFGAKTALVISERMEQILSSFGWKNIQGAQWVRG